MSPPGLDELIAYLVVPACYHIYLAIIKRIILSNRDLIIQEGRQIQALLRLP